MSDAVQIARNAISEVAHHYATGVGGKSTYAEVRPHLDEALFARTVDQARTLLKNGIQQADVVAMLEEFVEERALSTGII